MANIFFVCFSLSQTLYTIRARVEPSKGSELCRAGNMCHLHIVLQQVGPTSSISAAGSRTESGAAPHQHSIMYEVLADQSMWAVCGRTAGEFSFIVAFLSYGSHQVRSMSSVKLPANWCIVVVMLPSPAGLNL